MSDQKIGEFRERAQAYVAVPDPGLLLQRGRRLRRRRQLVPVAALAACAVIGVGFLAAGARDTRTDEPPTNPSTVTQTPSTAPDILGVGARTREPGTYALDSIGEDGLPDATVELEGEPWETWETWSGGAVMYDSGGTVSWGFQKYEDTPIEACHPKRHAASRREAVDQLSNVQGTVTKTARPATKLGLSGTYLQLSVPTDVNCPKAPASGSLMASWPGPGGPNTTVDVWLLEDGDRLLILTRAVLGDPSLARLGYLDRALATLEYLPHT